MIWRLGRSGFSVCPPHGRFGLLGGGVPRTPPPTTEGLQECRRVGIAVRARLRQVESGLAVRLLRRQEREIARQSQLDVVPYRLQALGGRLLCFQTRVYSVRIELQGGERVSDVLERRQHHGPIVRTSRIQRGNRSPSLMDQRAALK